MKKARSGCGREGLIMIFLEKGKVGRMKKKGVLVNRLKKREESEVQGSVSRHGRDVLFRLKNVPLI